MTRFGSTKSDNIGVQRNRRLTRRERSYNDRAHIAASHSGNSSVFLRSPSHSIHCSNPSLSNNRYELLRFVSDDFLDSHSLSSHQHRVRKRKRTHGRPNQRTAFPQEQAQKANEDFSALVDATLIGEQEEQERSQERHWLFAEGLATTAALPHTSRPRIGNSNSSNKLSLPELVESNVPMLHNTPTKESSMIRWDHSPRPSFTSMCTTPLPLVDVHSPWVHLNWPDLDSLQTDGKSLSKASSFSPPKSCLTAADFGITDFVKVKLPIIKSQSITCMKTPELQFGNLRSFDFPVEPPKPPVSYHPHLSSKQIRSAPRSIEPEDMTGRSCKKTTSRRVSRAAPTEWRSIYMPHISAKKPGASLELDWDPTHARDERISIPLPARLKDTQLTASGAKPGSAQPKITSFYKTGAGRSKSAEKEAILRKPPLKSRLPKPVTHHPRQDSHQASQVFTILPSEINQLKPTAYFSSFGAHEAPCAVIDERKPCTPHSLAKDLGGVIDDPCGSTGDSHKIQSPDSGDLAEQEENAWMAFIAARLPTFAREPASLVTTKPVCLDSVPSSPTIGSLWDLPAPPPRICQSPVVPTVVQKWMEERKQRERKACTLYHEESPSALEESSFDLGTFKDLCNEKFRFEQNMDELCTAMDTLKIDQIRPDHVSFPGPMKAGAVGDADQHDEWNRESSIGDSGDESADDSVLVNYEDASEADEWAMLSPSISSSAYSDDDILTPTNFDLGSDSGYQELSFTDRFRDQMGADFSEAMRIPLPLSPSTEHLVKEDTKYARLKMLSELDEAFVELAGMDWGDDADEVAVPLAAWSFGGSKTDLKSPFSTFPLVDGDEMGQEGMEL